MTKTPTRTIAAVLATAIGLSAVAPAMAQPAPPPETSEASQSIGVHRPNFPARHGGGFGLFAFTGGSEAVEVALVRLSHRITFTAEQQALFDTLRTEALSATDAFESATEGLMPQRPAAGQDVSLPSIPDLLDKRIAFEKAQLAMLEAVQPAATAFFDSLTEAQQAELMPQPRGEGGWGHRGGQDGQNWGPRGKGPHR